MTVFIFFLPQMWWKFNGGGVFPPQGLALVPSELWRPTKSISVFPPHTTIPPLSSACFAPLGSVSWFLPEGPSAYLCYSLVPSLPPPTARSPPPPGVSPHLQHTGASPHPLKAATVSQKRPFKFLRSPLLWWSSVTVMPLKAQCVATPPVTAQTDSLLFPVHMFIYFWISTLLKEMSLQRQI